MTTDELNAEERTPENGWRLNNENCPHCGVSLQGEPIPEKSLTHKDGCDGFSHESWSRPGDRCHCLIYGKVTHFGRKIGIEVRGVYDGVLYYQCPDCAGKWHRWEDAEMRRRAQPYINGTNQ